MQTTDHTHLLTLLAAFAPTSVGSHKVGDWSQVVGELCDVADTGRIVLGGGFRLPANPVR